MCGQLWAVRFSLKDKALSFPTLAADEMDLLADEGCWCVQSEAPSASCFLSQVVSRCGMAVGALFGGRSVPWKSAADN